MGSVIVCWLFLLLFSWVTPACHLWL
jgi:hypothetical protein